MSSDTIKTYIAENPRMIGVLFAMFLLLTQAGNVAAWGVATSGP